VRTDHDRAVAANYVEDGHRNKFPQDTERTWDKLPELHAPHGRKEEENARVANQEGCEPKQVSEHAPSWFTKTDRESANEIEYGWGENCKREVAHKNDSKKMKKWYVMAAGPFNGILLPRDHHAPYHPEPERPQIRQSDPLSYFRPFLHDLHANDCSWNRSDLNSCGTVLHKNRATVPKRVLGRILMIRCDLATSLRANAIATRMHSNERLASYF
jgi:hypothetical protein